MKNILVLFLFCITTINTFGIGVDINEPKTIKSEKIEYNINNQEIKTSGKTEVVNSSGQTIKMDDIHVVQTKELMKANNIELWLGDNVYIFAEDIMKDKAETIANDAWFTPCYKCDSFGSAWSISGNPIIHDSDSEMVYFHNAVFWVYDNEIPILWLPYFSFPDPSVKYKTGLLVPSIESTNGMGTQINIPLYVNLSDKHDFTTTLSYLTNENPLFQLEHRLNISHSEFRTKGSYTHNKEGKDRWYVDNADVIEMGENVRANIFVQRTSDKTYLQKYGFYNSQPYLDSGGQLEVFGQNGYAVANAHIFQELRTDLNNIIDASGNILPNIKGVYQTNPLFAETYLSVMGDVLGISNANNNSSSQRLVGEVKITSPWTLWFGNRITANLSARYDVYNFKDTQVMDGASIDPKYTGMKNRFLPSGYIEWDLPLFSLKNSWTYIIEPKARLTITEHANESFAIVNDSAGRFLSDSTLFANNRYAGLDEWANSNYADYGMRWTAFNNDHNIEVFVGQTYDFNSENVDEQFYENGFRKGFSDYVGRITYNDNKYLQLSGHLRLDKKNMSPRHTETSVYLTKTQNTYFNVGHMWDSVPADIYSFYNNDNIHEFIVGAGLGVTKKISLKGSLIYNASNHIFQNHNAGIFYTHPCYYLSLEYHRDNAIKEDYVGNTTFQFRFGFSIDGKRY